ncbi:MAG: prenyltransferase [Syntrophorhabdus sp. PtaU1.Bin153]|nr:MAG: prenyltransferase [Syntrophorhabdus sp. PtaU1.Bin153]
MVSPLVRNLRLFMAVSRTSHSILDVATPALTALVWLGNFPPPSTMVLGLITALAGYTAVYALNDLVDYEVDKERLNKGGPLDPADYLDTVYVRHPVARGLLTFRKGFLWACFWASVALIGAYLLNPICALIFLFAILMETAYCRMAKVSHLRIIVSGFVKTSGPVAAVFAVDPNPQPLLLSILFLWFFFWEVGGQNIPADWFDVDEDRQLGFRTIPARFGLETAGRIILVSIIATLALNILLFVLLPHRVSFFSIGGGLVAGFYLLLLPAYNLYKARQPVLVSRLFNRASFYPLALLAVILFDRLFLRT